MTFMEYLCEAKTAEAQLLPDFNSFKKWLSEYPNALDGTGISEKDIERLYKVDSGSRDKNFQEPVVANYHGQAGKFALRHWTARFVKPVSSKKTAFMSFHNTKLGQKKTAEETGKLDGEKTESVICYAWNKRIQEQRPDEAEKAHGGMDDAVCAKYYAADKSTWDAYVDAMLKDSKLHAAFKAGRTLRKLEASDSVTDTWKKYGQVAGKPFRPSKTPKTDIITSDGEMRISCKKASGAQVMSSVQNESVATIIAALAKRYGEDVAKWPAAAAKLGRELQNKAWPKIKLDTPGMNVGDLKKMVASVAKETKTKLPTQDEIYKWLEDGKTFDEAVATMVKLLPKQLSVSEKKDFAKLSIGECDVHQRIGSLLQMFVDDVEFREALVYEAATGEIKFGSGSQAVANTMFMWDDKNPDKSIVLGVKPYAEKLGAEMSTKIGKDIQLNFKKNGKVNDMTLRVLAH